MATMKSDSSFETMKSDSSSETMKSDSSFETMKSDSSFETKEFIAADTAVFAKQGTHLTDIQKTVLKGAWQGYTYEEIADREGYSEKYLKRDVGPRLWKILSEALGEKVSKKNFRTALERRLVSTKSSPPRQTLEMNSYQDWDEAVDVPTFYGRTQELATLKQWLVKDRCRLVALLGMGGIGKTALSIKLAQQIQDEFEYIIWRSLRHGPPIEDILVELIYFLSGRQEKNLPETTNAKISQLLDYLRKHRCLIILDNLESVLRSDNKAGYYREEYKGYGQLLKYVGETYHQSCLVLTSREKPKEFALKEGEELPVRSLRLTGLDEVEGQHILKAKGLSGLENEFRELIRLYGGNPLLLNMVSTTIQDVFDSNVFEFLEQKIVVSNDIKDFFDCQFERLQSIEKEIMYWLTIERESVSFRELKENFVPKVQPLELAEALESLRRRSLIEKNQGFFTQQPVLMEYITNRLVKQVCKEISTQQISLLRSHSLLKAMAKDYVRDAQISFIFKPVIDQLVAEFENKKNVELQLSRILSILQKEPLKPEYTGGNIINLLNQMQVDLSSYDFSNLRIWQAYLQAVNLHQVNFAHSDLADSVFTKSFGSILSLAFSSDGQFLITVDINGETHLWQVENGKQILTCKGHINRTRAVAFSPNSQIVASSSDYAVRLYNVMTNQYLKTLYSHSSRVCSAAFSPNGRTLAIGSNNGIVKLWKIDTSQCLKTLQVSTSRITSIAYSPDGQILANGSNDGIVKLWQLSTGECLQTLQEHTSGIQAVVFSPDGQVLASSSNDGIVKLWEASTGKCLRTLQEHASGVQTVSFSPDGQILATGSNDQTVRLWDTITGECLKILSGHTSSIQTVSFSSDGQILASGGNDQIVRLWEVDTGQCLRTLQGCTSWITSIAYSPDSQILASGGSDQTVRLWNTVTSECLQTLQEHTSGIQAVVFSPDGQVLASSSNDGIVKLWEASTGKCLRTLQEHASGVQTVSFSPDGQILATGSNDQTVRLWDTITGECLKILSGHTSSIQTVSFSSDGQILASGSDDGMVKLWDVTTSECLKTMHKHDGKVHFVTFTLDKQALATSSDDGTINLWNVITGQCLKSLPEPNSEIGTIALSPDGQILASDSSDYSVKLWDAKTGQVLELLQGHTSWICAVAFSPVSQNLASSSQDGTIRLWDINTGKCLKVLRVSKPYEGMNITGVTGLTDTQKSTLKALGAVESSI